MEYIITVMSRDRPGIISGIGKAVYEMGGNIEEISQTVVRGYFTVILCATFPSPPSSGKLKEVIASTGAPGELEVGVHMRKPDEPLSATPPSYDRFILTLYGRDQPGVIYHMASYLASVGINITDLYGRAEEGGFTMVLELSVPPELDPRRLKEELERLGRSFGMSAHFQHENLFKATHDLRSLAVT
ncbi:TPA: ACT domain-containing protein [Candidatus Poribacteria bacterium]|nr:ACT domain-containing protein [Candidatus Poribacteria bacterium]